MKQKNVISFLVLLFCLSFYAESSATQKASKRGDLQMVHIHNFRSQDQALEFLQKEEKTLKSLKRKNDQSLEDSLVTYDPDGSSEHPVLYILGGMGPEAGFSAFKRALLRFPHRRIVLDQKCSTPDRTMGVTKGEKSPHWKAIAKSISESMVEAAQLFKMRKKVDFFIACNTAHAFLVEAIKQTKPETLKNIRIHSLIDAGVQEVLKNSEELLLLSTTGTKMAKLYQKSLEAESRNYQELEKEKQEDLMKAIYQGVKGGDSEALYSWSKKALQELIEKPRPITILAACTEIPMILNILIQRGDLQGEQIKIVDPVDIVLRDIMSSK